MKKRLFIILAIMSFIFTVFFTGCYKGVKDTEKAISYLKNLDTYSCDIVMKIQNDKQIIDYSGKQFYDKRYGYRFELEGNRILIYKDNSISVKDLENGASYSTDKEFDSLFKLSFIGEYIGLIYTNESLSNSFKTINKEEYQVIHLDIPGNNKNINSADLYISLKDNLPRYLKIYDTKGKENINVEYTNFKSNPELQKELFDINT